MKRRLGHRRACDECRRRHVKCDGKRPECTPCIENRWVCTTTTLKCPFRHDHNPTAHSSDAEKRRKKLKFDNQPWVAIPSKLLFLEDSDDTFFLDNDSGDSDELGDDHEGALPELEVLNQVHRPDSSRYTPEHLLSAQNTSQPQEAPLESIDNPLPTQLLPATENGLDHLSPSRSGQALDNLPDIHADGISPNEYLDAPQWPETSPYSEGHRSYTEEFSPAACDELHWDSPSPSPGLWPLMSSDEAILLRYFVTDLAHWFDFCSRDRHFATTVVQAASTCETLLNAIFAVSAKHLSLKGEFDPLACDRYQRKCLQILIPALNHERSLPDSTLFASTAILRLLDEMTDHDDGRHQARRGHILDTRILLLYAQNQQDHQAISVTDSSLRAVSLLVTLRQDIFISFLTRTPPPPSPLADDHHYHHHLLLDGGRACDPTNITSTPPGISPSSYDHRQPNNNDVENRRLHEPSGTNNGGHVVDDDYTHAAHIITLTADVLTACHSSGRMSIETWRRLHARLAAWERAKPPSFRPVRYERAAAAASSLSSATTTPSSVGGVGEGGGVACNGCGGEKGEGQPPRFFPRIWFANDCHVGAQLYADVCRILLLVHDPSLPTLGLDRAKATQRVDGKVRGYVRRMCGVAVSHPSCQPAASVTGMVIAMCGDRFTDREEQEELLCIIEKSEAHLTWPYLKAGEQLRAYWGR